MEVWLVRHAKTIANDLRILQHSKNDKLCPEGVKQALTTGKLLAREQFHEIFISDLNRTKETLANLSHTFPTLLEKNIITTPMIREQDLGTEDALKVKAARAKLKELGVPQREYKIENGESLEEVQERAEKFLSFLAHKYLVDPCHLLGENSMKQAVNEYFHHERQMNYGQRISPDDYVHSPEEKTAFDEYWDQEKALANRKWICAPKYKGGMLVRKSQVRKEKEQVDISHENRIRKILVLTHSGFISEFFNLLSKRKGVDKLHIKTDIFNCSVSVVSLYCNKTLMNCNGSCMEDPEGMMKCLKHKVKRRYDASHVQLSKTV